MTLIYTNYNKEEVVKRHKMRIFGGYQIFLINTLHEEHKDKKIEPQRKKNSKKLKVSSEKD